MASRFMSLAFVVSEPCRAWLRYHSFIKRGSDALELMRQAMAHGTQGEQKERVWQLLAKTVLKNDITKCRRKNGSALRNLKHRLLPLFYEYAKATVEPDLPCSVRCTKIKQLGVYFNGDMLVSSKLLEENGLKGWVEALPAPFNSKMRFW